MGQTTLDSQVDFDVMREGHRLIVDVIDDGGLRIETREAEEERG